MNHFHYISLGILALIFLGWIYRRKRNLHIGLMATAMAADLGLVLWIELSRHAVEQALGVGEFELPGAFLAFHIVLSVVSLLLWFVQLVLGIKIARGKRQLLPVHKLCALFFVLFRLANFVTSLWL